MQGSLPSWVILICQKLCYDSRLWIFQFKGCNILPKEREINLHYIWSVLEQSICKREWQQRGHYISSAKLYELRFNPWQHCARVRDCLEEVMWPTGAAPWLLASVQLCVIPSTAPSFVFQLCPYIRLMLMIRLNGNTKKAEQMPILCHTLD